MSTGLVVLSIITYPTIGPGPMCPQYILLTQYRNTGDAQPVQRLNDVFAHAFVGLLPLNVSGDRFSNVYNVGMVSESSFVECLPEKKRPSKRQRSANMQEFTVLSFEILLGFHSWFAAPRYVPTLGHAVSLSRAWKSCASCPRTWKSLQPQLAIGSDGSDDLVGK